MIVDDDYSSTSLLQTLLEMDGFEVRIVSRGNDTLSEIETFPPDVFIIDYHLNDTSGIEVVKSLRATEKFKVTPVLMASGRDVGKEAMEAGANMFLVKPYDPSQLADQLMGLINNNQ